MRRPVIGLLAIALATSPGLAPAQNANDPPKRVGYLSAFTGRFGCGTAANPGLLARRLAELGWIDRKTLILDCVSTTSPEQAGVLAAELVARRPDVLATQSPNYVRALKQVTTTIPIVMVTTPNPVELGVVTNLARPEANVTGIASSGREVVAKRIELMKELQPKCAKLAVIHREGGDTAFFSLLERDIADAATKLSLASQVFVAAAAQDYDEIFARLTAEGFDAAYINPDALAAANLGRIVELSKRYRIATVGDQTVFAEYGLLLAYGEDADPLYARAAEYVDKILRGAKPGDLPVEQATKFNLVVNLKTANALGLVIPEAFLLRADKIIE